jgi:glyoxylase-like metal-dependent hydrolase (beta-lactamase superfamily II)/rhodanese-related sulfurtransferase
MKIEQIYTGCLSQGAYYIQSEGEAAVIDPLREVASYIEKAEKNKARIKYVFETHFHADFVSGHLDLSNKTGALIVYGPGANPDFEAHIAKDGEVFRIGKITIKVLHTPGHTLESSCYLLINEEGKEIALFSGDTLFIGDVGRPDLAQKAADMTEEELAGILFKSLRNKVMPLPDDIIVYPAHGAGSACGKNMSKETNDTLGHQKKVNYALRKDMTKDEFIKEVTDGLLPPPAYFSLNVMLNKKGYESIDDVLERGNIALNPDAFEAAANDTGALILDTRAAGDFAKGFIPNSINIGIDGSFAPWVGSMVPDIKQQILLVVEKGREEEVITRLARVGYDYTIGYLKDGIDAWKKAGKEIDTIDTISAEEFARVLEKNDNVPVLDVRKEDEFESGHIEGAVNAPLDYINDSMLKADKDKTTYVHCGSGYRSMVFASTLKARGYDHLVNIQGGFNEIKDIDKIKTTDLVSPA